MKCKKCGKEVESGKVLKKSYGQIRELFVCNDCFKELSIQPSMYASNYP